MQVVDVDVVRSESFQARIACRLNALRACIQAALIRAFAERIAKLRRKNRLLASSCQTASKQTFIRPVRIQIRSVDKFAAAIQMVCNRRSGNPFIDVAVIASQCHRAQHEVGHGSVQ